MVPTGQGGIIELMRSGIGWQAQYSWDGKKVILAHKGYATKIGNRLVSLPLHYLIGYGSAEETPLDEDRFSMKMEIVHPLWGRIFSYGGTFSMVKDA